MKERSYKTKEIVQLNEQVFRIRIAPIEGDVFKFKGGQYLVLNMPDGKNVPLSIASPPEESNFIELHVRLIEGHPLAEDMITLFKSTESFSVDGPFGDCVLHEGDRKLIIIAGGTGFSPMKSMIESAFSQQSRTHISLYLGAQKVDDLYQNDLAENWQKDYPFFTYTPVVSEASPSWNGAIGFPHEIAIADHLDSLNANDYYVSGSGPMVMAVYNALLEKGVEKQYVFSDMLTIKRANGEID